MRVVMAQGAAARKKSGKWYRGGSSKRRTGSRRVGTGTGRREAGCTMQLRKTRRAAKRGVVAEGGGNRTDTTTSTRRRMNIHRYAETTK